MHTHTPVDLDIGADVLDGRLRGCARCRADRPIDRPLSECVPRSEASYERKLGEMGFASL